MTTYAVPRRGLSGPAVGAAVLSLFVSISALWSIVVVDRRLSMHEFNESAISHARTLEGGLTAYFNKLVALGALFDAAGNNVTRQSFTTFSKTLLKEQNAILGVSWIPRVRHGDRAAHEAAAKSDGILNYRIQDVGPDDQLVAAEARDEYFPIYYSSKEAPDSKLYGFDLRDNNGLREQMLNQARDEGAVVASKTLVVRSGAGNRNGFLVVLPIYRAGMSATTKEERRANLDGFVLGVFQVGVMVESILSNVTPRLDFFLFEPESPMNANPLHVHSAYGVSGSRSGATLAELAAQPHWSGDLVASEKRWHIVSVLPQQFILRSYIRGGLGFAASFIIGGLVTGYLLKSTRHAEHLEALARADALTGLPNRRVFAEQLTAAFASAQRGTEEFAVHFIDLDGFKEINDTLGHAAGDALLRTVAERLRGAMRTTDIVARFGGDEFAILQTHIGSPPAAGALAGRIVRMLKRPYVIDGQDVGISASVGICAYSRDISSPDMWMIQADRALYLAKRAGRNRFCFSSMANLHDAPCPQDEVSFVQDKGSFVSSVQNAFAA